MTKKLPDLSISEAEKLLVKKDISAEDLVKACLQRVEEKDSEINAFITVTAKRAIAHAKKVDQKRAEGKKLSPLAGIPYTMKDVYLTKGIRTTAGSKILDSHIATYNATVYKKLHREDAILIGKVNCDPFGFGSSTENSAYGVTKNPYGAQRVAGGSSGGSGAAVAYGGGLFSIAEDTGGSIRCPASFCGVVGIKPTYGRVSRYGSIAYASSYDTVGAITKTVEDNALILKTIAGQDDKDANTSPLQVPDYLNVINEPIKGKKIGVPQEYFDENVDPQVLKTVKSQLHKFTELGCELIEISLPHTKYAVATYYVVGLCEASANLARYDGIRYGEMPDNYKNWSEYIRKVRGEYLNAEEKRRVMIGTFALSAGYSDQYYKNAQRARQRLREDFNNAFQQVDVIVTPTMPILPFKIGEKIDDPLQMWLADTFTVSANPLGVPALSIPAGTSDSGLPIGMQFIAPHFAEEKLFNFAHYLSQA